MSPNLCKFGVFGAGIVILDPSIPTEGSSGKLSSGPERSRRPLVWWKRRSGRRPRPSRAGEGVKEGEARVACSAFGRIEAGSELYRSRKRSSQSRNSSSMESSTISLRSLVALRGRYCCPVGIERTGKAQGRLARAAGGRAGGGGSLRREATRAEAAGFGHADNSAVIRAFTGPARPA